MAKLTEQLLEQYYRVIRAARYYYTITMTGFYPEVYWPSHLDKRIAVLARNFELYSQLNFDRNHEHLWPESANYSEEIIDKLSDSTSSPPQFFYWVSSVDVRGNYKFPNAQSSTEYELKEMRKPLALDNIILSKLIPHGKNPGRLGARKFYDSLLQKQDMLLQASVEKLDRLTALNPELLRINVNRSDFVQLHHVLHGIVSDYNVDDINFFISSDCQDIRTTQEYENLHDLISIEAAPVYWIASPETLVKIYDGFKAKNAVSEEMEQVVAVFKSKFIPQQSQTAEPVEALTKNQKHVERFEQRAAAKSADKASTREV